MKKIIVFAVLFVSFSCSNGIEKTIPTDEILNFYKGFSSYTDPGEHASLFDDLPESLKDLCSLIKHQFIHPIELGDLRNSLPEERHYEDPKFPTVSDMLEGLLRYDERGLTFERKRENRLIVACYHHALLLASMLRHRGIPARIRTGFARYFEKEAGVRFGHAICEVWDKKKQRWILVDPDRQFVDFSRNLFEFSDSAWKQLRAGKIKPGKYVAAQSKGDHAILHILLQDLSCVLLEEKSYWDDPAILQDKISNINAVDSEKLEIFDQIAELLSDPDANLEQLSHLHKEHSFLRGTGLKFEEWFNEIQEN
jgi:excinuclease ABC subunit A